MDNQIKRQYSDIDQGWAWVVCFACFIVHVIFDGIYFSVGVIFVEFLDYFGGSKRDTALIASLCLGVGFLFGPVFAAMSNRFGCRTVVILGGVISSAAYILSIFSPNVFCLYATFGIMAGFGYGCVYFPSILSVNFYFERRRALATGLGVAGNGVGLLVFGPLTKYLIETYTWKGTVLIQAGILLNAVACGLVYRPIHTINTKRISLIDDQDIAGEGNAMIEIQCLNSRTVHGTERHVVHCLVQNTETQKSSPVADTHAMDVDNNAKTKERRMFAITRAVNFKFKTFVNLSLFKNKAFVLFLFGSLLSNSSYATPYVFLPDKAKLDVIYHMVVTNTGLGGLVMMLLVYLSKCIDGYTAAWLVATIGISNLLGRLLVGVVSDLKYVNRMYVYIGSTFVIGASITVMPFCHTAPPLFVCCLFFGFSFGGAVTLSPVLIRDFVGKQLVSEAFGILNFFWGIAFLIGQPIIGWLFDISGTYFTSFIGAGVTIVTAALALALVPICGFYPRGGNRR